MSSYSQLSDEELVKIIRTKDKELYQEVMLRYQTKLLRYANYLLSDSHQAEDAVQQAFIKAYVNLNSFNSKKKFSSWIYRITHNEAINLAKKHKSVVNLATQYNLTTTENIEDDYIREEISALTQKCISKLPLSYREPITLYFIEGYSYKEISDILHLPISTVGVRLKRGKNYLKVICQNKTN